MPGIKNTSYKGFYAGHSGSVEGGWMLWSGSFFMTNSAGTRTDYRGVGIEAVGSSESYFRFSSSNGGSLDVRANKFFIGNPNLQFISGSDSDIEISGSGFHVRPLSNGKTEITASAGRIGNWQIKDGVLSGSNATLDANGAALYMSNKGPDTDSSAAFDLLRDEYYIDFTPADQGNTRNYYVKFGPNFAVDHSGSLHASGAVFQGTITTSAARIGDWHVGTNSISSSGGDIVLNGDTTPEIIISAPSGPSTNKIQLFSHAVNWGLSGTVGNQQIFRLGSTNEIAGWTFDTDKLSSNNLEIKSSGEIVTSDFTSSNLPGSAGRGWRIKATGEAEFENASIRGTLNTAVFEKQSVNVVGGQLLVSNGTTITGSALVLSGTTTIPVKNADGFVVNEYIISKATGSTGFTTETMKITGVDSTSNPNTLTVTRNADGGGAIPTMSAGQVLASAGVSGSGYIHLNAAPSDSATPYIDIIERTGSNAQSTKRRARLGDLSGVAGEGPVPATPGFGLYSENVYLSGTITASAGRIGGWKINANTLNDVNSKVKLDASGLYPFSSSGFQVDTVGAITASAGKVANWEIDPDFIRKVSGNNNAYILSDATGLSGNHAANPAINFFNNTTGNKVMVNVGNIYKNSTNTGFALFSDYSTNTKVFEVSKNDSTNALTAQIAGWTFDNAEIKQANVTMSSAGKITIGNPAAQRIELNGTNASMSFFDGDGNTVMTLDDNIDGSVPGISMTEGTILITGSTDYGGGATFAPPGFSTVLTNVTAGGSPGISDSRIGAMFALSDGSTVNTDYTDFTTTFVDSCGTKGGGGGGACYDVGAIVGSVHNAEAKTAMVSGYGHDAYGIMSRAIVGDPSKNQQYSFFGEHGNLVNSQSAIIGGLLEASDYDHMLTVYEPVGGADKGIGIVIGDSGAGYVHFMNSTTGTTADNDGWKIGMNSSEDFIILNEEENETAIKIAEEDNEIWLGGKVTIGKDAVGTTETEPCGLSEGDSGTDGSAMLIVKCDTSKEAAVIAAIGHNYQSHGVIYVGQSATIGGGIMYDGSDSGHVSEFDDMASDKVNLYRSYLSGGGADSEIKKVAYWSYDANQVSFVTGIAELSSDERLKENVKQIESPIEKIKQIRGVHFDWKDETVGNSDLPLFARGDLERGRVKDQVGVIAQEVEKVLPQVVQPAPFDDNWKSVENDGREQYKTVKYEWMVPLLIEGIKEQQTTIENLKSEIEEIKKCLQKK